MTITTITQLHCGPDQRQELSKLLRTGRDRMRAADGCVLFDLLTDETDAGSFIFLQRWDSHDAHDAAFAERIVSTGHLEKVLAALDRPLVQQSFQLDL
jgi:quinol monooxygenase YgiN